MYVLTLESKNPEEPSVDFATDKVEELFEWYKNIHHVVHQKGAKVSAGRLIGALLEWESFLVDPPCGMFFYLT